MNAQKQFEDQNYPAGHPVTAAGTNEFWKTFTVNLTMADTRQTSMDSPCMSLFNTLYEDNIIPHRAGLKPCDGDNRARHDEVKRCAKDFLDSVFPLKEGSHRDAVCYMPYYQNLLVILADGSTTGLKTPSHFDGKNGPAEEPDSILLNDGEVHAEVIFNRNGRVGEFDLANIDDIQLEATNQRA